MPIPAVRMRLCCLTRAWPCKEAPKIALNGSKTHNASQRRVLLTSNASSSTATHTVRSPHQWSHIAHHIRNPALLRNPMAGSSIQTDGQQVRNHAGHSHGGHHHHHDNTYLTSSNKSDPGVRITRIGLYVNLGMAIAKGAGGYVFNSKA